MTKRSKGRVRRSNKRVQNPKNLAFFIIIFVILAVGILFATSPALIAKNTIKTPALNSEVKGLALVATTSAQASASAAPKPTPSPSPKVAQLPVYLGHTIHVPILYYHYIGNNPNPADTERDALSITPDRFTEEMKYLSQNGYNSVTYPEVYAALMGKGTLPAKPVMLSFDDGYIDFFINAFPILQQYHIKSVSFLPTGKIDTGFYLKWDQVKQMNSTGLVDFEAHSVDHSNLQTLNQQQLVFQLTNSKQKLESELGRPVLFMAYPYGTSDERVWAATKAAGYLSAAGTWYSSNESEGQVYDLPRIRMGGAVSLQQFIQKIQ